MKPMRWGVLLVLALAVWISWGAIQPDQAEAQTLGSRVIKRGMVGDDVKALQNSLKVLGYQVGAVDGIYGGQTLFSVKAFQKDFKLVADGVVGSGTIKALQGAKARQWRRSTTSRGASRGQSVSREDLTLLARVAFSEARGESYQGQVAVVAVVLNRLKDSRFPKTIKGIVFEPWAFTAVNDGQFWLEPNATAYKAAQDAVNGWEPTGGAVYYYNPAKTTNKWIWSRPVLKTIGKHIFAK
ncbi:MAG: spore cortex-lytic enzyme [Clostridia bacterium]|nr:spore cortex-lytic enzyme [Clostridia bacterium]